MASYNYDGVVIMAIAGVMRDQLTSYFNIDDSDLSISRGYQASEQYAGANPQSVKYQIYINPVTPSTSQVGRGFKDDIGSTVSNRTYENIRRVTYQVNCLADYDEYDDTSLEAQDLAQAVNELIMQLDSIESLIGLDLNMQSVTSVRPSFTVNNQQNYESTPSFDMTLTYNVEYAKEVALITSVELADIYGI